MGNTLRDKRLEIRYLITGGLLTFGLVYLSSTHALAAIESHTMTGLNALASVGLVGLFIVALVSNLAVIVNIPFMLVALTWVFTHNSPAELLAFSLATGLGAGIGKFGAYVMGARVAAQFESLAESSLVTRIDAALERRPRLAPLLIFVGAGTVLPLDAVLVPLMVIRYPARLVAIPLCVGKVVQSATLALGTVTMIGAAGTGSAMNADLTLGVLLVTLLGMAYQFEKSRAVSDAQSPALATVSAS